MTPIPKNKKPGRHPGLLAEQTHMGRIDASILPHPVQTVKQPAPEPPEPRSARFPGENAVFLCQSTIDAILADLLTKRERIDRRLGELEVTYE